MVTSYNAKDCTITVNNAYLTGLGEDMVTGEKDEEFFESETGAQGDTVVNEKNDDKGTITITLQATSPQNAMMISLAKSRAYFPIWVTNKSLGERFGGTSARVKKYPEFAEGATAGDREYEIAVFDYTVDSI